MKIKNPRATFKCHSRFTFIKLWRTISALLLLAACSLPAAKQFYKSQSLSLAPDILTLKMIPDKPEQTGAPTIRISSSAGENQASLKALYQRAIQGDINAQVDLGTLYYDGGDYVSARYWWTVAANRGHQVAHLNLRLLQQHPAPDYDKPIPPKPVQKAPKKPTRPAVTFFGTPGKGQRFIFVIDKSWSMLGDRLPIAKTELLKTLRQLPAGSQFMIYFFNHVAEPMPSGLLPANQRSIALAENWIRTRGSFGGTNPRLALKWAFELQPDTVWLLSDGLFANYQEIFNQLQQDNPKKAVRVNTVAFCDRTCEKALQAIARTHGGTYRFVAP